jgi:capsular polysaccharide biosynthesis protein
VDIWELCKLVGRRWYLGVPMLVLTLVATGWALTTIKPDYSSEGTIILVPPADKTPLSNSELTSTNTWVELGEDVMAQAVTISVQTKDTRDQILKDGFIDTYTVTSTDRSNLIIIDATAPTAALAQGTVQRVQKQIANEVEQKQAVFRPKAGRSITTQVLDDGDTVNTVSSKVKRAAVIIIGVGLLLTVAVTILGDLLLKRRARAKFGSRPRTVGGAGPDPSSPEDTQSVLSAKSDTNSTGTVVNGTGAPGPKTKAGAGVQVAFKAAEAEAARREVPDDSTIVIPLGGSPWAGREKDAEANKR